MENIFDVCVYIYDEFWFNAKRRKRGLLTIVFFAFLSLTQMVVTVPHEMLSKTYQTISELFPATYAANGYYTIIFGGVSLERNIISLLVIVLVTQSVAVMTLAIKGMEKGRRSSVVKEV
ncbi:hypothetical protein C1I58_00930 [Bacillus sp. PIC28]|nr:hypothetical protein C1I58_00930 [Bacillus sp. PIC28]